MWAFAIVIADLASGGSPDPPTLRAAATLLDGAWRFHTGDDQRWADANTDDCGWETIELTAVPGSHDGDVGLPDYVGGWMAHHAASLTSGSRLGSVALFALIGARIVRSGHARMLALVTLASITAGLFGAELLDTIGVPGIWFPFGIGVSRTQYVYAIAIPLMAFSIVRTERLNGEQARTTRSGCHPDLQFEPACRQDRPPSHF